MGHDSVTIPYKPCDRGAVPAAEGRHPRVLAERRTGFRAEEEAGEGTRTPNLLITNQLLYQLSYASGEPQS